MYLVWVPGEFSRLFLPLAVPLRPNLSCVMERSHHFFFVGAGAMGLWPCSNREAVDFSWASITLPQVLPSLPAPRNEITPVQLRGLSAATRAQFWRGVCSPFMLRKCDILRLVDPPKAEKECTLPEKAGYKMMAWNPTETSSYPNVVVLVCGLEPNISLSNRQWIQQ